MGFLTDWVALGWQEKAKRAKETAAGYHDEDFDVYLVAAHEEIRVESLVLARSEDEAWDYFLSGWTHADERTTLLTKRISIEKIEAA